MSAEQIVCFHDAIMCYFENFSISTAYETSILLVCVCELFTSSCEALA